MNVLAYLINIAQNRQYLNVKKTSFIPFFAYPLEFVVKQMQVHVQLLVLLNTFLINSTSRYIIFKFFNSKSYKKPNKKS